MTLKSHNTSVRKNEILSKIKIAIKNSFSTILHDKTLLGISIFFIVVVLVCQYFYNVQTAKTGNDNGVSPLLYFSWSFSVSNMIIFYLALHGKTHYDKNNQQIHQYSIIPSFFLSFLYTGILTFLLLGFGKITWFVSGGIKTQNELSTIRSLCLYSDKPQISDYCTNCTKSIIVYNVKENYFYDEDFWDNLEIVNRLKEASSVVCMSSYSQFSESCDYEGGDVYNINYEEMTIDTFSLPDVNKTGSTVLYADPPDCPFFVMTTDGKSDFPFFTEVAKEEIIAAINQSLK